MVKSKKTNKKKKSASEVAAIAFADWLSSEKWTVFGKRESDGMWIKFVKGKMIVVSTEDLYNQFSS